MKKINPKNIMPASYNPRTISDHAEQGLKNSMDEFGDISGITWNKLTGNLISGHQRWNKITKENLDIELIHSHEDKYKIMSKANGYLGYDLRIVEWTEIKEKAANLTANNQAISGEFDKEQLATLLKEMKEYDSHQYQSLNFDILEKDMCLSFEEEWESDIEKIERISEHLNGLPARIIIECPTDLKDEVLIYIKAKFLETSFEGVHVK
jgi:hypothetical protein